MAWLFGRKGPHGEKPRSGPTTEQLNSVVHTAFVRVTAAAERCAEPAREDLLAVRTRELAGEL
ncbi:hypothetical protein [Actinophytocola sp.]|uniref:hypothetical protein n=1 Tax=Actinophytocola sp. TaxID=1872138 RepID=UPI002ED4522F